MKIKLFGVLTVILALFLTACPEPEPTHVHQWGAWMETTAPTCTTEGEETRTCTLDPSHQQTRPIAALGHTWGAWQYNATEHWKECTAHDGAKTDIVNHAGNPCTDCGYTAPDPECECPNGSDHWEGEECCKNNDGEKTKDCTCKTVEKAKEDHLTHTQRYKGENDDSCYVMFNGVPTKRPNDNCVVVERCKCGPGTKREPGVPCCEDPACPCPIAEPDVKNFEVSFNFANPGNSDVIMTANIKDARTACGSATLEDIEASGKNIVTIIKEAIQGAFNEETSIPPERNGFRNLFGATGGVTIYVDNPATFYKVKASDSTAIYFHIDYLKSNPVDIQNSIFRVIMTMAGRGNESLPIEITRAIGRDAVRMASVGASGQHLKQTAGG